MSDIDRSGQCAVRGCIHLPSCVIGCGAGYTLDLALASVGPGWQGLVREAFAAKPPHVAVEQVKEKYAGLRIYIGPFDEAYQAIVDGIEERSFTVCEECGQPGSVDQSQYWIKTRCAECRGPAGRETPSAS